MFASFRALRHVRVLPDPLLSFDCGTGPKGVRFSKAQSISGELEASGLFGEVLLDAQDELFPTRWPKGITAL